MTTCVDLLKFMDPLFAPPDVAESIISGCSYASNQRVNCF